MSKFHKTYDFHLTIKKAVSRSVIRKYLKDIYMLDNLKTPGEIWRDGNAGGLHYTIKWTERKDNAGSQADTQKAQGK